MTSLCDVIGPWALTPESGVKLNREAWDDSGQSPEQTCDNN